MREWVYLAFVPFLVSCSIMTTTSEFVSSSETKSELSSAQAAEVSQPVASPEPQELSQPKPAETFGFVAPDTVRGIYVTAHSASGERMNRLLELMDQTDLNSMVIDIKDDWGNITFKMDDPAWEAISQPYLKDPKALIETLKSHNIYPIARIVAFKDTVYANRHPEYSFLENGHVWKNGRGESFVNPFLPEVWKHNVEIAKKTAELGFQEIQFDYVRFPEGFENMDTTLQYSMGEYQDRQPVKFQLAKQQAPIFSERERLIQLRVDAVTDFVAYAKQELQPLGVKVSVDIFGYTATLPEAPGIGQNFSRICENVDVISSMIYPSHWGPGYFGIPKPDLEPYRLVSEYSKSEIGILSQLQNPVVSRPWLQDFTASWLGSGNYRSYGKAEVEAQIKALQDHGIREFLLWNAGNTYTEGVDYTP